MDLIDRAAAVNYLMLNMGWHDEDGREVDDACEKRPIIEDLIGGIPTIEAVPLDKLCEWLSEHSVIIPCETCRNFSNGYCMAIGDMDKPCPNKAEDWQRAIKEWMKEEQHD